MKRKELAIAAGVHPETLRYYEGVGLLPKPLRNRNGYRDYGAGAVERVRFIKQCKDLGLTLKEIQELMELRARNGITCRTSGAVAQQKIDELDGKIAALKSMRKRLVTFRDRCAAQQGDSDCAAFALLDIDPVLGRRVAPR